jgi:predicted metal-binding membrane protein
MRYGLNVTDFIDQHEFRALPATDSRIAATLARPRRIALGCVVALTALGWLSLGLMTESSSFAVAALCRPNLTSDWSALALAAPMWAAMTLAMMLPTAGPMILTYAEIADTAAQKGEPVVSPLVLIAGYAAVWLGFALAAALLQWTLAGARLLDAENLGRLASGAIFIGAGLYQFSSLKRACLTLCQRPFPFFFANWTTQTAGVLRLGLAQGIVCLGCCWALMLLTFAVGAMNVIWMAALGVVMTIEKLTTTPRFSEVLGFALVAIGFVMVVASVV